MEFKKYKIGEIGEVIGGGTPSTKKSEYYGGNIPWITPKDLSNFKEVFISEGERNITEEGLKNSSARTLPSNTVLMTSRAPIGYLAIAKNEVTTNQGFKSIICNESLVKPLFLYYSLKNDMDKIKSLGTGSTFSEISGKVVKNIEINLPSIEYQTIIEYILGNFDKKIELNQKIIANLEELSQTLFKRWFVDFEFPDENGNPYKSSGGELVDSELGEKPINWDVAKLRSIVNIRTGYAFKSTEYVEQRQLPVLRTLNISKSNLLVTMNEIKYVPYQYLYIDKYKNYNLELFDTLLVTVGGSIGNLGLVTENNIPSLQNQNMWRFRSIKSNIGNTLVYQLILYVNSLVRNQTSGSAREFYTKKTFENFSLLLPKEDSYLYENINKYLENFGKKISDLNVEIEKLTQLRDTLLPKLMSGEIEIPDDIEVNEDELSI